MHCKSQQTSTSYAGHAETAELIFCPYNYILDPVIRRAVQIDLQDAVIILDEAHNIEDICRYPSIRQCQLGFENFKDLTPGWTVCIRSSGSEDDMARDAEGFPNCLSDCGLPHGE